MRPFHWLTDMASTAQLRMLFGLYKGLCRARGWSGSEAECRRDEITVRALKVDAMREVIPSWSDLTEGQVDAIRQRIVEDTGEVMAVTTTQAGTETLADAAERSRLVFAIERDSAAAYDRGGEKAIATILSRMPGLKYVGEHGRWRGIGLDDLRNLAKTLGRCERSARGRAKV